MVVQLHDPPIQFGFLEVHFARHSANLQGCRRRPGVLLAMRHDFCIRVDVIRMKFLPLNMGEQVSLCIEYFDNAPRNSTFELDMALALAQPQTPRMNLPHPRYGSNRGVVCLSTHQRGSQRDFRW
ncbi:hypothetical protein P5673_005328 [Acropora cervicornis]|uniref:Uncharacterized protein n=1 Tax=Acropora cervicornis TaxID=6130 RepID=A0AAD9VD37_ACRCE|nr:hypothetical protein P5673_005328 [Acropora cervicornis]